jgi:hypothetical protein
MLRVTIESFPHSQENKARTIGLIYINDNNSCTKENCTNFDYQWLDNCDMGGHGEIDNHNTNDEVWSLLLKIFKKEFDA